MSKYNPLSERLAAHPGEEWKASFSELESVLGFPLPKAARTGRAWWANDPQKSHSRAWTLHGWEIGDIDHAAERVVFRRGAASAAALVAAAGLQPLHEPADAAVGEVQPPAMREAAEAASACMHATRSLGLTAMVAAGVALVAGAGAMLVRGALRRAAK